MPVTAPLYLLDTNILIHAVRGKDSWERINTVFNLLMVQPTPVFSVVSEGEILAFAEYRNWGLEKREQASFFLGSFKRISIDAPDILRAYAFLDGYSRSGF